MGTFNIFDFPENSFDFGQFWVFKISRLLLIWEAFLFENVQTAAVRNHTRIIHLYTVYY